MPPLTASLPQIATPAAAPAAKKASKRASGAAKAFTPRDEAAAQGTPSAAVRTAIVKEQAAQRAEELAKSAEDVTKADRAAATDARQKTLIEANEASRETAAKLVQESLRRTAAARVAAASDRQAAESTETTDPTGTDDEHHPDRRPRSLPRSGCGDRRPLRPVRHVVALSHRTGLPGLVRHPHPRRDGRRGALRRQLRRLGRQPRRHQARRRQDHDVLAHVVDGGPRRPGGPGGPGHRLRRARPVARSERTCTSSCTPSGSSTATSTRRSIPLPGWPRSASRPTESDRAGAPATD